MPPGWANRRAMVLLRDGYRCVRCGAPAEEVDHRLPRSRGGGDELTNLRSLCRPCHKEITRRQFGHHEAQL